jgi:hypothetical protein
VVVIVAAIAPVGVRARAGDTEPGQHDGQNPGEHEIDAEQPRAIDAVVPLAVHG